jgi:hypothetical protein
MPHLPRPALAHRFPVHCTWRMRRGVWNLRTRRCFSALNEMILTPQIMRYSDEHLQ